MTDIDWDNLGDYTFDPAEEYLDVGGKRLPRRRFLASAGAAVGALAAGPIISTKVDADELFKSYLKTNLPYNAHTSVKGHITMWHHYGSPLRHGAIRTAIALFKHYYPHVSVSDVGYGFTADWTAMKTAVAADKGVPDVIVSDMPKLYYDGTHHVYESLTSLAKRDRFSMNAYWPFIRYYTVYKGNIYGLGWETDCRVLMHVRATWVDNGLKPDAAPKYWQDIASFANKLDKKGGAFGGYSFVTFDPLNGQDLTYWAATNRGYSLDKHGNPIINDSRWQQTAGFIKQWLDRYGGYSTHQAIQSASQGDQSASPLTKKNTAFQVDAPTDQAVWEFFDLRFYTSKGQRIYPQFSASLLPYNKSAGKGAGPWNINAGFALSMPRSHKRSSAQRDASWEFIKFMSLVGQKFFAEKVTAMPSVVSIAQHDATLKSTANWKTFAAALHWGWRGNRTLKDQNYPGDVLGSDVVNPMYRGDKSIKDTLDSAVAAAKENFKKPGGF